MSSEQPAIATELPVELVEADGSVTSALMSSIDQAGLECSVATAFEGTPELQIRFPGVQSRFAAKGLVLTQTPAAGRFAVALQFQEPTPTLHAIVERIGAIENYRRQVAEKESRPLSSIEAAMEWQRSMPLAQIDSFSAAEFDTPSARKDPLRVHEEDQEPLLQRMRTPDWGTVIIGFLLVVFYLLASAPTADFTVWVKSLLR